MRPVGHLGLDGCRWCGRRDLVHEVEPVVEVAERLVGVPQVLLPRPADPSPAGSSGWPSAAPRQAQRRRRTAETPTEIKATEPPRPMPGVCSHSTIGLRPIARNADTAIRIRTPARLDDRLGGEQDEQTPHVAPIAIQNGLRVFSRRAGHPERVLLVGHLGDDLVHRRVEQRVAVVDELLHQLVDAASACSAPPLPWLRARLPPRRPRTARPRSCLLRSPLGLLRPLLRPLCSVGSIGCGLIDLSTVCHTHSESRGGPARARSVHRRIVPTPAGLTRPEQAR